MGGPVAKSRTSCMGRDASHSRSCIQDLTMPTKTKSPRKSKPLPPKKLVERAPCASISKANLMLKARGAKRSVTTMKQRIDICKYATPGVTLTEVHKWANETYQFNPPISYPAIHRIVKMKDEHVVACDAHLTKKRKVHPNDAAFDGLLIDWLRVRELQGVSICGDIVRDAARTAAGIVGVPFDQRPEFTKGWLYRFQARNNLSFRRYHGEAKSVTKEMIEKGRQEMQLICQGYRPDDIFNMDETAFYYRMAPNGSISTGLSAGVKQDKTRVTLCVGSNSSGSEKLPLLCIGKSKEPVCFRGHDVEVELGVQYTSSKKGWMNSPVFEAWLQDLNSRMMEVDRKILLLVDNVSSHKKTELSNIRLEMLPKNTTSVLQPMDQGIIHALKSRIKLWKQVTAIVKAHNGDTKPYKADLLSALEYCGKAWQDVSATTIANCWRKAGILNNDQITTPDNDLDGLMSPFREELLDQLRQTFY